MVCLVGMKTGRMENRERKIGRKILFSTVWLGKENGEDIKPGRNFSLPSPHLNREEKLERKVLSQHFYTNTLFLFPLTVTNTTATNTIIFLSNISKLKYNQIIRIQTQKHNFKINQIITIKGKKKKKKRQKTEAI